MRKIAVISTIMILSIGILAQTAIVPFHSDSWQIDAQSYVLDHYKGKECIYLKNGKAYLKDVNFQNGIIEFDLFVEKRRSFSGVIFRIADGQNYEEIYLRPHLSGKPDAMQYTPVYNRNSAWQLYHDQGLANFDGNIGWEVESVGGFNAIFDYPYDRWFHLKLVVSGTRADLYLDDGTDPVLQIRDLKRGISTGSVGIRSGRGAVHFANFSVQLTDNVRLKPLPPAPQTEPLRGIIPSWQIGSIALSEKSLSEKTILDKSLTDDQSWTTLKAEKNGVINISKLHPRQRDANTVLAKVIIQSDSDQIKRLDFGYSDRARVYCNGKILYTGDNSYRSRDYRYLGTMGFFDAVYLPLQKGRNEVVIAVAETFGGWGLQAKLENIEGVTFPEN